MSGSLKIFLAMFVPTFLLYGGLKKVIFLWLVRFSAAFLWPELFLFGRYFSLSLYPLFLEPPGNPLVLY